MFSARRGIKALAVFAAVVSLPLSAGAAAPEALAAVERSTPPMKESGACPALFGDEAARQENEAWQKRLVRFTSRLGSTLTIAHSHPNWDRPLRWNSLGLHLVDSNELGPGVVLLSPGLAEQVACAPGYYRLSGNEALGNAGRVVALLEDLVIVDIGGELRYFSSSTQRPEWMMVWVMPEDKETVQQNLAGEYKRARSAPPIRSRRRTSGAGQVAIRGTSGARRSQGQTAQQRRPQQNTQQARNRGRGGGAAQGRAARPKNTRR